jgi:membrane-bound lytic murein transglycosylase MltF
LRPWRGDFDAMVERRAIRALVPFSRTFYMLDGATQKGFAVDVMREFEKVLNERIGDKARPLRVVIIPVRRDQLLTHLAEGRGDLAFGNLTITPERQKLVDFSIPNKSGAREIVVTGPGAPPVASLDDLAGKPVYVRRSSSYHEHLERVNAEFRQAGKPAIVVNTVAEQLEDEDLLELVNAGAIPAVVVDQHIAEPWSKVFTNIVLAPDAAVYTEGQTAWALRKECPRFKEVVDAFLTEHRAGTAFGNMILAKYFENVDLLKNATSETEMRKLRSAVDLFKKYSAQYDFDWLLVAAQAYQESGIDQSVQSPVGAVGVMQVLPSTAAGNPVNITGVETDMEKNIHAGVKYMRFMMDEYFEGANMSDVDRCLFAFASYNAGPARVAKLRKEAEDRGLDPNRWFQNVELIAAQRIGRETVTYVSNIYKYYVAYHLALEQVAEKSKAEEALPRRKA